MLPKIRYKFSVLMPLALLAVAGLAGASMRPTDGEDVGLMIVGTITNKNKNDNVALVKNTKTGQVTAVKSGYKIMGGTYLVKEVTGKYIIISKGSDELLVYQNKFAGEFANFSKSSDQGTKKPNVFIGEGFERRDNKIRLSSQLRDKLVNEDLSDILMQATAIPKIENGNVVGFRILQIDKDSIYDKAGLIDNDVITSINGIQLSSVAGAVRLLKSLKSSDQVQIDFIRNGVQQSLELSVSH